MESAPRRRILYGAFPFAPSESTDHITYCMCNVVVLELSQAVVDAGAVPLLVLCIQEPELSLKRIAASGLSDICKHSPEVNINLSYLPITRL